ncbi:MAG: hypothetical protein GEU89_13795 [Kiloniellaceae bacterium]|nr:hypothetical protein [Kiloniellaceae bacterium]
MPAVINEFVFNHTGSDDHEFVEIFGDPNTDYSDLWLLQIEGDSPASGTIDSAVQVGTTDGDGFWSTGFSSNTYENGTLTLLLVENFTGSVGDDIDLDNDGAADSAPWSAVVDSVAVNDGGADDRSYAATELSAGFDGGAFVPGGASRIPDGTDSDVPGDWLRNDFDLAGIDGFSGTPTDDEALNTPGTANAAVADVPPPAPPSVVTIPQIQGAGHQSAYVGQTMITTGIVTALESNGFFMQDPNGDGNIATSDAIFVFTNSAPSVAVGDFAVVTGGVSEFIPGGAATNNLSITQLVASEVNVAVSGLALPEAVVLGEGGRVPPTDIVEDDAFGSFDPETDGIDFFESLEGMRVTVPDAVATSADNRFGETWAVANQGANAGDFNERGGIILQEDDLNPERVQIQFDADTLPGFNPSIKVGDGLGDVTGVVDYNFGNYEVKVTEAFTVTDGGLAEENSALVGSENQLTVASYNILNVSAAGGADAEQIARLAEQIVNNLNGPDIIALQEVQDDSGETDDGTVTADVTLQAIVDAIAAAGGPQYEFVDVDPVNNTQGGVPGGNIRVAYLYNPNRVDLVEDSVKALDTLDGFQAGQDARVPLEAQFTFNGETVTLINNHLSSKFGSSPVYGAVQPFINAGDDQRTAQTASLNAYVDDLVATDPEAKVIVLGDMNDFQFSNPINALKGSGSEQVLFNQIDTLGDEAYTYNFEGNSQVLDHLLVSEALKDRVEFDIVHQNVDFGDAASTDPAVHNGAASDHEPILARISFGDIQAPPVASDDLEIEKLATYDGGLGEGSEETVAYDSATQRLFITNSDAQSVDIVDISDPAQPQKIGSIDTSANGSPTQVAVKDGIVAVAIDVEDSDGVVAFYDADGSFLHSVTVGNLPDHLVFTPDGMKLLVANEGEDTGDPANNPLGSVSIIDLSSGLALATVQTADFTAFDGMEDALREAGVRIFPGESVSEDVEPEYIAVSPDGTQAFVALQEANAVAILDIATATFLDIVPLGAKDHSLPGNLLDPSDEDGEYDLDKAPVFGMYMPDQIASFEINGETFYITANEGDARSEDERIKNLDLDPEAFPDADYLQQDSVLGRLQASSIDGDTDGDGDIDQLFVYGARSFSIWNAGGEQVFDSGDMIERVLGSVLTDEQKEALDGRSDNKGAEPEGVTVGMVGDQTYAFVGLERANGVMVFNISDPTAPEYVEFLQTEGDIGPEGMTFIAADESPNGKALLAVSNEVSGTTTLYEIEPEGEGEEPSTFTLQILHASDLEGGVDAIGRAANFAAIVDILEDTHENSITLSAGDNYLSGPFFSASEDQSVFRDQGVFNDFYNELFGLEAPDGLYESLREGGGRVDISVMNAIGFDASALGNHEFDLGTSMLAEIIAQQYQGNDGVTDDRWVGAQFPYLSANLDFSGDPNLAGLFTDEILMSDAFKTGPDQSATSTPSPKIAKATIIEEGGELIGIVGATTPGLAQISSPGDTTVIGSNDPNDMDALAAILQPVIDEVVAQGVNKVILVTHLQQIALEKELIGKLSGVDIIIAGGSDTLLADDEDVQRGLNDGDTPAEDYPFVTTNKDGDPAVIVSTDGEYSYVGRLVLEFDDNGVLILNNGEATDETVSGAFATTDEQVAALWGNEDPFAEGTKGDLVSDLTDAVEGIVIAKDGNILGKSDVYLEGRRGEVRTEETNFGNLSADANLAQAQQYDDTVMVSIKNGGGIRSAIGTIEEVPPGSGNFVELPPQDNPASGKQAGEISQLDVENALKFNNGLTLITLTAEQLLQVLEHGVAATASGATPGQFPQVGGIAFSFDPSQPAGNRIQSAAILGDDGNPVLVLVENGELVVDPGVAIRVVTLDFLAGGGDSYPFASFASADPAFANVVHLKDVLTDAGASDFAVAGSEQDAMAEYLLANYATTAYGETDTAPSGDTRIQNLSEREDTVLDGLPDEPTEGVNETGTRAADLLEGGSGDDTLSGDRGDDTLLGGDGDDQMDGGRDDDALTAGDGDDSVLGDRGDDTLDGGEGDDHLDGGRDDDLVAGGEGDDIVLGDRGRDSLDGGEGDDHLDGGRDDDLVAGGEGDDTLLGDRGDDSLDGGEGDDSLLGGRGEDTLAGGEGDDTLTGGRDDDLFIFGSGDGSDVITDFEPGDDLIQLNGFSIASFGDLMDMAEDIGDDVVVTLDDAAGDELHLVGVNKADLSEDDFMLNVA